MDVLLLIATTFAQPAASAFVPATSAALAIAPLVGCTTLDGQRRRPPARLVVEPAYFDDEVERTPEPQPATAPRAKVPKAKPTAVENDEPRATSPHSPAAERAAASFPKVPSGLSRSGRERCKEVLALAEGVAERHGLDLGLVMAVARVESDYVPEVKNRTTGATGLMQLMPSTAKYMKCGDLDDPEDNLECGARVLRRYLDFFGGDVLYAVAAYHAGPKWAGKARDENLLPNNFTYVEKVMRLRTRFKRQGCE
jgi:soluble lytic murein transglycosylase-like protein